MRIFIIMLAIGYQLLAQNSLQFTEEEKEYIKNHSHINMCVDPDWEPFERINEKGEHVGIASDLIQLVAKRVGITIELYKVKTWEESLEASKSGKCQIMSFLNQSPKRDKWLNFTQPIFYDPNVFITREEHPFIANPGGLINHSIALPKGTMVEEKIRLDYPNIRVVLTENENEAIRMVSEKKVDMTMRSLILAVYSIKKEGWFNLKVAGQIPEYENKLRIGVIKTEPLLRDILDKGVHTLTLQERELIANKHVSIKVESALSKEVIWSLAIAFFILIVLLSIIFLWNHQLKKRVNEETQKVVEAQSKMFQVLKEAEIGNLVANISHQWRDGLANINYTNLRIMALLATRQSITKEILEQSTHDIETSLTFLSDTMRSFLDYYKPSNDLIKFNVADSMNKSINIIRSKIHDTNATVTILGDTTLIFDAIQNEWMQVWICLITNSLNAAKNCHMNEPILSFSLQEKNIEYHDNCGGIDNETLLKIQHESFSGLGLKICHTIAKKYNKKFVINNDEGGIVAKISWE